jgi:uncharacterized protein YndB with AHSA1/START domain
MRIELTGVIPAPIEDVFDFLDDPANAVRLSEHAADHAAGIEVIDSKPDGRRTVDIRMRAGNREWVQTIEQIVRERPTRLVTRGGTWQESQDAVVLAVTTDRRLSTGPDGTHLTLTVDYEPGRPSLVQSARLWLQRGATRLELEHQLYSLTEHFASHAR